MKTLIIGLMIYKFKNDVEFYVAKISSTLAIFSAKIDKNEKGYERV